MEEVILVNEKDEATGSIEKMAAHEKALLHRAFSIFILNDNGELLLQQRAHSKYHSGGLWTNTCCSHPRPGETNEAAATRRLFEEMGFTTTLNKAFSFIYKANFENGLTEYEYDHVFVGKYLGKIEPNTTEVAAYKYTSIAELETDILNHPRAYTAWFKIAFPKFKHWLETQNGA
jgi:isopentenyl-diphosphate Delta-isomerase